MQNKVTDKFKRPFKKRHSSVYHQPQNRVNKYLSQAIEARSVDREKSEHVSLISLAFKDSSKESQVSGGLNFFFICPFSYWGKESMAAIFKSLQWKQNVWKNDKQEGKTLHFD